MRNIAQGKHIHTLFVCLRDYIQNLSMTEHIYTLYVRILLITKKKNNLYMLQNQFLFFTIYCNRAIILTILCFV